jgi:thioredoxin reductase
MKSIAIIGAGPIGLEAGLVAEKRGYEFAIYERGAVAESVSQWGHVRMFSPFAMNASATGGARLKEAGYELPAVDRLLSGSEFRESYLVPLAETLKLHIKENCAVLAIGRSRRLKGEQPGEAGRGATPFRLLLRDESGERIETADIIVDCSGTYTQPNSLGEGGLPAPGEASCVDRIHYYIPDLAGAEAARFDGRGVLVVGAGHSAATAICGLAQLQSEVLWLIRRKRELPAEELLDDPLPERARLAAAANQLIHEGRVRLLRDAAVEELRSTASGIEVRWSDSTGKCETVRVDEIIAATGFRPDLALTRELQVHTCWATEGTYPLAASLLGEAGADCLTAPVFGAETLLHPEPDYFTLGIKSYGRAPNFLLRTGYEQVASVFDWLEAKAQATPR